MRMYLNPHCDYGKGLKKWRKIEGDFRQLYGDFIVEEIKSPETINDQVEKAFAKGEKNFAAAGGDGTVNLLLNALMNSSYQKEDLTFGAIGLGSSNDFHKPFRSENFIEGIPVKIDWKAAIPHDVIFIQFKNSRDYFHTRYCMINASVGITAQANAIYNSRIPWIEFIQKLSIEGAILASALKTLFTFKNIPCQIALNGTAPQIFMLTNLGVIKNPHFAGGMCYDTTIQPDDGKLGVNVCHDMTIGEAIGTLIKLYQQQFQGRPKTQTCLINKLSVKSDRQFALEMDGEVVQTNEVKFEVLPKAMRCCP
jgi:diacylglycerol kinase (ATP)